MIRVLRTVHGSELHDEVCSAWIWTYGYLPFGQRRLIQITGIERCSYADGFTWWTFRPVETYYGAS